MFVYNFLADGIESGHLILDDTYWIEYFNNNLKGLYSSEYSVSIQKQKFLFNKNKFHVIARNKNRPYLLDSILRCLSVSIPSNSDILIQGFEESSILFFLARAKFKGNSISLILTNNICTQRINSNRFFLKRLLKIIFRLSDKIIYHTKFELMLIDKYLMSSTDSKFKYVKYQLLTKDLNSKNYIIPFLESKYISFFGPIKSDKPIEPFLNLIKADTEKKFLYRIYNPGIKHLGYLRNLINGIQNVEIINEFLSFEKYEKAVQDSAFIFLSHNSAYEGKLSGNICDCISKRKPFISNNISPVKDFIVDYGQIGFIYDLENDPMWAFTFLNSINEEKYNYILRNLERMQLDFTDEKIKQELDLVFSK